MHNAHSSYICTARKNHFFEHLDSLQLESTMHSALCESYTKHALHRLFPTTCKCYVVFLLACWVELVLLVLLTLLVSYIVLLVVFLELAWMRTLMRALQLSLCCARAGKPTLALRAKPRGQLVDLWLLRATSRSPWAASSSPTSPAKLVVSLVETELPWGPSWDQRTTTTMCLQYYLVSWSLMVLGWPQE